VEEKVFLILVVALLNQMLYFVQDIALSAKVFQAMIIVEILDLYLVVEDAEQDILAQVGHVF
jgi:hypothetical protein